MPQKETIVSLTTPEESSPQNETTTRLVKSEPQPQRGASETLTTSSTPMGDGQTDFRRESVVALVGSDVDLYCSSPVNTVFRWSYRPLGRRASTIVYNGRRINRNFKQMAGVGVTNCGSTQCTLTVSNLQLDDAGIFICETEHVNKFWSVTLLGKTCMSLSFDLKRVGSLTASVPNNTELLPNSCNYYYMNCL